MGGVARPAGATSGNHVLADIRLCAREFAPTPCQFPYEKHCRIDALYGNHTPGVF